MGTVRVAPRRRLKAVVSSVVHRGKGPLGWAVFLAAVAGIVYAVFRWGWLPF